MNILLIGLTCILLLSCNSAENDKNNLRVDTTEIVDSTAPAAIADIGNLQSYIDSLNELKDFKSMPSFLDDSCIDANVIYWKDLHHPTSARKYIIENTTNIELLKYIIRNNLYRGKCNSDSSNTSIPFYNLSLNDMVKERLDTLAKTH